MTEQEFIEKWKGNIKGTWAEDADRLYWARSYEMHPNKFVEMSQDYISVPLYNRAPCSRNKALSIVNE